jgi:hypothetical protein
MTTKNFKNLGANPVQVTLAPGEFNNTLQTNIPRQQLPYDYFLASNTTTSTVPISNGNPVSFDAVDQQSSNQGLIEFEQVAASGSNGPYTIFKLKKGHLYSLKAQIFEEATTALLKFGWYNKENVFSNFDETKIVGRKGKFEVGGSPNVPYVIEAKGFFDASNFQNDAELVVAVIAGGGGNKILFQSYAEITNITSKTGPWA